MRILALLVLLSSTVHAADKLDEAAARTLIEQWLKAQNTQDFAGYQALYAKKFDGIKRAGARTRVFDRKSWLADRQKMFAKPMTVAADDLEVTVLPGTARVRFVQSFTLNRFHDQGPKELVLMLENGHPVITREEMLSSKLAPLMDGEALFVVPGGILLPVVADDRWGRGAPRLVPLKTSDFAATRAVDPARVPAAARAWVGRPINLVGNCSATVKELALLVRVDPPVVIGDEWTGRVDADGNPQNPPKPIPPASVAATIWKMAPVELIGVLDQTCPGANWGTMATTKPTRATVTTPSKPLERAALAAMRRHAAYLKLQHEYEASSERGTDPKWDEERKVRKIDGPRPLLILTASRMDSCSEFSGGLTFVFAVGPNESLTLLNDPAAQTPWALDEAADLDGDGTLELLGHEIGIGTARKLILRQRGGSYQITGESSETLLGCYC